MSFSAISFRREVFQLSSSEKPSFQEMEFLCVKFLIATQPYAAGTVVGPRSKEPLVGALIMKAPYL